jgi:hypothetical protein
MVRELLLVESNRFFQFHVKGIVPDHDSNFMYNVKRDRIRFTRFRRWRYVIALVYRGSESSKSPSLQED